MSDNADGERIFRRLLFELRPYYGRIALGLLFLLMSVPCELFPAVVWKYVTDDIVLGKHSSAALTTWFTFGGAIQQKVPLLVSAVTWLFVIYLIGELLGTLNTWILSRVAQRFMLNFRNRVYRKLQSQSLSYLQRHQTGDLMSRAMGDVDELQKFIVGSIDVIISESILWLSTVVIVMSVNWKVASASLAPLMVVWVLLGVFNKRIRPIYSTARTKLGALSARLQENLSGVVVIKIFGREREEAGRFEATSAEYYDAEVRGINARNLYFPFSRAIGFLSNVFMIGVGGYYMVTDGSFTPGDALMFRAYWWRLFGPVQTLARVSDMVQRASAAGKRVYEILDSPEELPDAVDARDLPAVRGELALQNVTFGYRADEAVLADLSLTIPAGGSVAICGPSGAGKSTVLNLLLRFYDPTGGEVMLDGVDLRSIKRDSLRSHFALVQQDSFLFNDRVIDNIRYGLPGASEEQAIAAAKAANAHGFISKFPDGYQTIVGERGVRLSGGQKQRISIARAFLANRPVLLLDEPTSSVEPESEAAIIRALQRLMRGRTTALTSHRPSLILAADLIYVIEDGRITEAGSPAELREGDGWFARFIRTADREGEEMDVA